MIADLRNKSNLNSCAIINYNLTIEKLINEKCYDLVVEKKRENSYSFDEIKIQEKDQYEFLSLFQFNTFRLIEEEKDILFMENDLYKKLYADNLRKTFLCFLSKKGKKAYYIGSKFLEFNFK